MKRLNWDYSEYEAAEMALVMGRGLGELGNDVMPRLHVWKFNVIDSLTVGYLVHYEFQQWLERSAKYCVSGTENLLQGSFSGCRACIWSGGVASWMILGNQSCAA